MGPAHCGICVTGELLWCYIDLCVYHLPANDLRIGLLQKNIVDLLIVSLDCDIVYIVQQYHCLLWYQVDICPLCIKYSLMPCAVTSKFVSLVAELGITGPATRESCFWGWGRCGISAILYLCCVQILSWRVIKGSCNQATMSCNWAGMEPILAYQWFIPVL